MPPLSSAEVTPAVTNAASKPKASAQPDANSLTPGHGAQFFIRHKGSIVRVLDVSEGSPQSGTPVIAYSKKPVTDPGVKNQLWKFEPAVDAPGWWYLKTAMDTGFVMTLASGDVGTATKVTVQARDDAIRDHQLWHLVSTEELGYFFIQSRYQASEVPIVNPNSDVPTVLGVEIDRNSPTKAVLMKPDEVDSM